jgi:hypothetical protein
MSGCEVGWKVSQADRSPLTVVGQDRLAMYFHGGGTLRVPLLVIQGLAADILLGNDFINEQDVCITPKDPVTRLKKVVFGLPQWSFPFLKGSEDQEAEMSKFVLAELTGQNRAASAALDGKVLDRIVDSTMMVDESDGELEDIPAAMEDEVDASEEYFLEIAPPRRGGQGRNRI